MGKPKSNSVPITYEVLLPGALAKRASEAMASVGLAKHNPKAMVFLADLVRRSTNTKVFKEWVGQEERIKTRFVQVSSTIARRSFNRSADCTAMIRALVDAGVIEEGRNYAAGSHCRSYRPSEELVNDHRLIHSITGRQAVGIVRAASKVETLKPLRCPLQVFEHQVATLRRLCVSPDAQAMLDRATREANRQSRVIDALHQHTLNGLGRVHNSEAIPDRLLLQEDQNGRLYSPVVNLAKRFRQYLRLDAEKLMSFDIVSCQPFLLTVLLDRIVNALDLAQWVGCIETLADTNETMMTRLGATEEASRLFWAYLKKRYSRWSPEESVRTKAELSKFRDLVCSGALYEGIMTETGYKGNRKSFKNLLFHALYARFMRAVKTQEWRCFARMFPRIAREIKLMKYYRLDSDWRAASKTYKPTKLLPCILQAIEAKYIYHAVCPALMAAGIDFITIHDCVLVKASSSDAALATEKQAFAQYDLHPAIKVETLETSNAPRSRPREFPQKKPPAQRADEAILSWEEEGSDWGGTEA